MSDVAIRVDGLGKRYTIAHAGRPRYDTLRDTLAGLWRRPFARRASDQRATSETFWALRDVSFEVKRGEAIGIIGRNGAGKSTLLKILSRIVKPTTGRAEIRGRVGSLLEVGTGFHPELTGRENIFLNGAILGMKRAEIRSRFDEIVAFAEVERFLDTPVKRYSSGMYTRLAFAVAAHLEPEVLIVDEVLAVGDVAFQRRCLGKMSDFSHAGRTVLFVSHNIGAIRNLTQNCVYLDQGQVAVAGRTQAVVERYVEDSTKRADGSARDLSFFRRSGNPDIAARFVSIQTVGGDVGATRVPIRQPFGFEFTIEVLRPITDPNLTLALKTHSGEVVTVLLSREHRFAAHFEPGRHTILCRICDLHPMPGRYQIDVGINAQVGTHAWDVIVDYPALEIVDSGEHGLRYRPDRPGLVLCPRAEWSLAQ